MSPGMTLFSVQAILVLSTEDGARIFAKYFTPPHAASTGNNAPPLMPLFSLLPSPHSWLTLASFVAAGSGSSYPDTKSQKAFEKGLIEKTAKQTGDIILYDNRIVLYKLESDVMIYLVGAADENEILLYNTLLALRDSLHLLFK